MLPPARPNIFDAGMNALTLRHANTVPETGQRRRKLRGQSSSSFSQPGSGTHEKLKLEQLSRCTEL
jgi:hypothetical protein